MNAARSAVTAAIAQAGDDLVTLSRLIQANPEIAWHEERAAGWLSGELGASGYDVTRAVSGLPTALTATIGSGPYWLGWPAHRGASQPSPVRKNGFRPVAMRDPVPARR